LACKIRAPSAQNVDRYDLGAAMESLRALRLAELTTEIVSAYVSNNELGREQLGLLIGAVRSALANTPAIETEAPPPAEPAVSIRKSVTPEYIVCLEDGRKFKSLKRHLQADHSLSPDAYRAKWSLPADYPMVAPVYSSVRSEMARNRRLGRNPPPQPVGTKRGRKRVKSG